MSPVTLMLLAPGTMLLLMWTNPRAHAQQTDTEVTVNDLMLNLTRRHMKMTFSIVEDVKLMRKSLEQMDQRMDTLEGMVAVRDCSDIAAGENSGSGVYAIFPASKLRARRVLVYCDIEGSDGWTVLQRRVDGSEDFDKDWATYKKGFGDLEKEHWLGNDYMHAITSNREYMIQFVLEGCSEIGDVLVANYGAFRVGNESSGYQLTLASFSGNATDGMNGCRQAVHGVQNGMKFSTKGTGRDNDGALNIDCAKGYPGGWWFSKCYCAHLNYNRPIKGGGRVPWNSDRSPLIKCMKTKMRIRPITP